MAMATAVESSLMIVYPRETPSHTRTARAQPPAAHRRRHSRPHHRRHREHSLTAFSPASTCRPAPAAALLSARLRAAASRPLREPHWVNPEPAMAMAKTVKSSLPSPYRPAPAAAWLSARRRAAASRPLRAPR